MKVCIALFRGVNVGGRGSLPMKELVALLEELGLDRVRTYIQSGNAVFLCEDSLFPELAKLIGAKLAARFGFEPRVIVLELARFEEAMERNPFPEGVERPETLHLGFLAERPKKPDLERLETLAQASERFSLLDSVFYLHAPEGIGRSKLAQNSERLLGASMTDRNWRTVCALRDMAREIRT